MQYNSTESMNHQMSVSRISPYLEWVCWHATPSCCFDQQLLLLPDWLMRFCSTNQNLHFNHCYLTHTTSVYPISCCLWYLTFLFSLVIQNRYINLFILFGFSQYFTWPCPFFSSSPNKCVKIRRQSESKKHCSLMTFLSQIIKNYILT